MYLCVYTHTHILLNTGTTDAYLNSIMKLHAGSLGYPDFILKSVADHFILVIKLAMASDDRSVLLQRNYYTQNEWAGRLSEKKTLET